MQRNAAGSERQDKQQASGGTHASVAVDIQDGGGRGQVATG